MLCPYAIVYCCTTSLSQIFLRAMCKNFMTVNLDVICNSRHREFLLFQVHPSWNVSSGTINIAKWVGGGIIVGCKVKGVWLFSMGYDCSLFLRLAPKLTVSYTQIYYTACRDLLTDWNWKMLCSGNERGKNQSNKSVNLTTTSTDHDR